MLAVEALLVVLVVAAEELMVSISGLSVVEAPVVEALLVVAVVILASVVVDAEELVVGNLVVAANTQSSLTASYLRPESQKQVQQALLMHLACLSLQ